MKGTHHRDEKALTVNNTGQDSPAATDTPLTFTLFPWANQMRGGKWAKVPLLHKGFTFDDFTYGQVIQPQWMPSDGQPAQWGFVCGPQYGLLVIDVDDPELFATATQTGQLIGRADAMSTRDDRYHVGLDYRGVPLEKWPKLGGIPGADVKANGFVAAPGSIHYSGARYEPVLDPDGMVHLVKPW
jgi:hypothetical protein